MKQEERLLCLGHAASVVLSVLKSQSPFIHCSNRTSQPPVVFLASLQAKDGSPGNGQVTQSSFSSLTEAVNTAWGPILALRGILDATVSLLATLYENLLVLFPAICPSSAL